MPFILKTSYYNKTKRLMIPKIYKRGCLSDTPIFKLTINILYIPILQQKTPQSRDTQRCLQAHCFETPCYSRERKIPATLNF